MIHRIGLLLVCIAWGTQLCNAYQTDEELDKRAKLCEELFRSSVIKLTVTASASVGKLLGSKYTVELRSQDLDLASWNKAISEKRWLDALGLLTGHPLKILPQAEELEGLRLKLMRKEFTVFVKTKADLSRTHVVSLSEIVRLDTERLYTDGKPVDGWKGSMWSMSSFWTRHPDGIGWHIRWWPVKGEIIIALGGSSPALQGPSYKELQNKVNKAGKPLLTQNNDGILQVLQQRRRLAELTDDEAIKALDEACFERHQAKRRVALAQ